jgi:hypothetical protein
MFPPEKVIFLHYSDVYGELQGKVLCDELEFSVLLVGCDAQKI